MRNSEHTMWFCSIDNLETKAYNNQDPPLYTNSENNVKLHKRLARFM